MNRCPYCAITALGLRALAEHIENTHPGREHDTLIVTTGHRAELPLIDRPCGMPPVTFPGVDIDAIHRTRNRAVATEC